jgi:hypothetical protein
MERSLGEKHSSQLSGTVPQPLECSARRPRGSNPALLGVMVGTQWESSYKLPNKPLTFEIFLLCLNIGRNLGSIQP